MITATRSGTHSTGHQVFLGAMVLVWLPYGVYCFLDPKALMEIAGIAGTMPTASTELRAMYGGLQIAIGALALAALVRPALRRPVVLMLACLCVGLALARTGGLMLDGGLSTYTAFALGFEIVVAGAAIALLRGDGFG